MQQNEKTEPMTQGEKTARNIVEVASRLFYERGYQKSSISDIVEVTGLSKGNITYHFKSKEDILKAVIAYRSNKAQEKFRQWEEENPHPLERINCFINSMQSGKDDLAQYGCRNGSLAVELGKNNPLANEFNRKIFDTQREWMTRQFRELSGEQEEEARKYATELLIRCQGVCVLSQVYNDPGFFSRELEDIKAWVAELSANNGKQ